ncbi:MAG: extracellular solute-binding protein [Anaerolineae bacterium]
MSTRRGLSRRDLLRSSALFTGSLVLAGCVSTPAPAATSAPAEATTAPEAPTAAPAAGEKATIRWQDWPDWEPKMDQLMNLIATELPDINVEFEPLGEGFEDKTLAMMVAGTAPDVITGWGPVFRKWAEKGQLLDLQPFVDRDLSPEQLADFHKWQWDGMVDRVTKIRFAVPYYINLIMLYYNKQAFDEEGVPYPDKDMDRAGYTEMLMRMTKKEGDKVVRWGGSQPIWYDRIMIIVQAYGGHFVNPDDWTECWLGKQEAQDALEWLRARMWDDNSVAQPLQLEGIGQATGTEAGPWAAGMLATQEDGMGAIMFYVNESKFDWALTHLPPGAARRATLGTTDGWAVYKGTKQPEACWKFLQFLTGDKFQPFIMEAWGGIPCRASLLPKWKDTVTGAYPVLAKANLDAVLECLEMGYPMLTEEFKKQGESEAAINAALEKVFQVGDTPVSYFTEVAEEVTKINREE